jgi:hypothetical protein
MGFSFAERMSGTYHLLSEVVDGSAGGGTSRTPDVDGSAGGGTSRTPDVDGSAGGGTSRTPDVDGSAGGGTSRTPDVHGSAGGGTSRTPDVHGSAAPGPSPTPTVDRAITVDIEAHVRVLRARVATVVGRIRADGLANATVQGTLGLHALPERRIPYDLFFTSDDGRPMRLVGEKDLNWLAPVETLVVLPFTIIDRVEGTTWTEIARGTLRFDVRRDWRWFARSVWASPF